MAWAVSAVAVDLVCASPPAAAGRGRIGIGIGREGREREAVENYSGLHPQRIYILTIVSVFGL